MRRLVSTVHFNSIEKEAKRNGVYDFVLEKTAAMGTKHKYKFSQRIEWVLSGRI